MNYKFLLSGFAMLVLFSMQQLVAQEKEKIDHQHGYKFTQKILLDNTPVKNQYRSGTCWSYAGIAFLESELLKSGFGEVDLSEAMIIRNAYKEKADRYVRWQGAINFGGGGAFHDVTEMIKKYGIIPERDYSGLVIDEEYFVHGEMDNVFKNYVKAIIENKNRKLTPVWRTGFDGLLDAYLGAVPEKFTFNGKEYTPQSFAASLPVNMDDYIELTSFTHHPFYTSFILELPDNWMHYGVFNVPLDDMIEIIDNSLAMGHTVAWAADVSEKGFSWKNGLAVVPDEETPDLSGTEKEKWESLTEKEQAEMLYSFENPVKKKVITQQIRQKGFDNYTTTDDHGMEIVGMAYDRNEGKYYIVKNLWGTDGHIYNGYLYASEAYVRYKTTDIMVNKNVIPRKIKNQLGL
jgi:bleomycin hydrolase